MNNDVWDSQVAVLKQCYFVKPRSFHRVKYECTPLEWAAILLYQRIAFHTPEVRAKRGLPICQRRVGRDPEKKRISNKRWRDNNKEKMRVSRRLYDYDKRYINVDHDWKLRKRLHKRTSKFFKEQRDMRIRSGQKYLCLPEGVSFVDWLVSQFSEGMTIANHGTVWHIDHWYPLGAIDCSDPAHIAAVQDHRNLRPLMGADNMSDGAKVTPEAQANFDKLVEEKRRSS